MPGEFLIARSENRMDDRAMGLNLTRDHIKIERVVELRD
jgi:hypothetical protein